MRGGSISRLSGAIRDPGGGRPGRRPALSEGEIRAYLYGRRPRRLDAPLAGPVAAAAELRRSSR